MASDRLKTTSRAIWRNFFLSVFPLKIKKTLKDGHKCYFNSTSYILLTIYHVSYTFSHHWRVTDIM